MDASDGSLVLRVSRKRDRVAFEELYQRFRTPAYNLAAYILHDRNLAEEAVQDAMLRLWTSSAGFQDGPARNWFLKIVVRECQKVLRRGRRRGPASDEDNALRDLKEDARRVEKTEEIVCLRNLLDGVSGLDRRIIGLYYSTGCSQDEISTICAVPQRTVSDRLEKVRGRLRAGMKQAGFSALLPAGLKSLLDEALLDALSVPKGLDAKIKETVGRESELEPLASAGRGSLSGWNVTLIVVAMALVGVGITWAAGYDFGSPDRTPKASENIPIANEPSASEAGDSVWRTASATGPFNFVWDFQAGELDDARVGQGKLRFRKVTARDGTRLAGMVPMGDDVTLFLPLQVAHRDFVVEVKGAMFTPVNKPLFGMWTGGRERSTSYFRINWSNKMFKNINNSLNNMTYYFKGQRCYCSSNGSLVSMLEFIGPRGEGLGLALRAMILSGVVVRSFRPGESVPKKLKAAAARLLADGDRFKKTVAPIPPAYEALR